MTRCLALLLVACLAPLSAMAQQSAATTAFRAADGHLRASKMVGAPVYNDENQKIGTLDDLLLPESTDKAGGLTAVISVGGFLGLGDRLVTVPFDRLRVTNGKMVMPGASRDALNKLPAYEYSPG